MSEAPKADDTWSREDAFNFADSICGHVVEVFSKLHPGIVMNYGQWLDLKEAIERSIRGGLDGSDIDAGDLLEKDKR